MQRVGMSTYMPQYRNEFRHHRSKAWITKSFPLFPGYLFTPKNEFKFGSFSSCDGVIRNGLICDAEGHALSIDDQVVATIREGEELGAFDRMREHGLRIKPGQELVIADGAMKGTKAVMIAAKNANHVRVLLNMFGREIIAKGSVAKIEKRA